MRPPPESVFISSTDRRNTTSSRASCLSSADKETIGNVWTDATRTIERAPAGIDANTSNGYLYNCDLTYPTNSLSFYGFVNCLSEDPQFLNAPQDRYTLRSSSPCINKGMPRPWHATATDLNGNPRLLQSVVDIGCYETPPAAGFMVILR
jgi:hypothetical protein